MYFTFEFLLMEIGDFQKPQVSIIRHIFGQNGTIVAVLSESWAWSR